MNPLLVVVNEAVIINCTLGVLLKVYTPLAVSKYPILFPKVPPVHITVLFPSLMFISGEELEI